MFWMLMTTLWVVMLVAPVALLVALLPAGRDCPRCGGDTFAIRSRLLHPVRRWVMQRWCSACGWEGHTRNAPAPQPVPGLETATLVDETDDDAAWRGERRDQLG